MPDASGSVKSAATSQFGIVTQIAIALGFCRTCARGVEVYHSKVRRALLIATLALLISDASGLSALVIPETCPIGVDESAPDTACPAFCVRCTCACCTPSAEGGSQIIIAAESLPPLALAPLAQLVLPAGRSADIFHVPKALLS
jgi:hypothetical protein